MSFGYQTYMKEGEPGNPFIEAFKNLAHLGTMTIPAGLLHPTIVDDWIESRSNGPICAYMLEEIRTGELQIWIADGNHRRYDAIRNAQFTALLQGTQFTEKDLANVMVVVRKVIPDPDEDIRYRWRCEDQYRMLE